MGLFLLSLIFILALVAWAQKPDALSLGPEKITLSEYNRGAGLVTFTHKNHGKSGKRTTHCATCHHTTIEQIVPKKCSTCHEEKQTQTTPDISFAFHKSCIGCHKDEMKRGTAGVSLTCDSCHVAAP